eukprot:SAG31_NODE_3534_length_4148_cov_982.321067_4_plen_101_part_00
MRCRIVMSAIMATNEKSMDSDFLQSLQCTVGNTNSTLSACKITIDSPTYLLATKTIYVCMHLDSRAFTVLALYFVASACSSIVGSSRIRVMKYFAIGWLV